MWIVVSVMLNWEVFRLEAHVIDVLLELGHRHLDGVLRGRRAEDRLGVVRDDVGQSTRGSIPQGAKGLCAGATKNKHTHKSL